jgi:aminoacrylate hydrolase
MPVAIIGARDDVLVPSSMSEALAGAIADARLHVASWGGHAINVTEPNEFNAVLLAFLARQP